MRASLERGRLAGLVFLLLSVAAAAALDCRPEGPLRAFLPDAQAVPGWARDGEPREFEGQDLYAYIDGGAEIYQEYGFRRVAVQDYKSANGKSVSLEIFEMEAPGAAYGMFTFKRSGQGKSVALGGGGELESYYLNFWKGRFLVTLTGFDEASETLEGLGALARAVDSRIKEGGEPPALAAVLPKDGLQPGSVKYLKGLLGLNNVYPFFTARGLAFKEAVRGLYGGGETLIVLDYGSAEARRAAWSELGAYLGSSERFSGTRTEPTERPLFQDGKGRFLAIGEAGTRLIVGVASSATAALLIVSRAQ